LDKVTCTPSKELDLNRPITPGPAGILWSESI
jgi:hypothetical protein